MAPVDTLISVLVELRTNIDHLNIDFLKMLEGDCPKPTNDPKYVPLIDEANRTDFERSEFGKSVKSAVRHEYPQNPAEAFIWKQGDWEKFKNFLGFLNGEIRTTASVVHYAFAQHLLDPMKHPIFDQHVCRSIWILSALEAGSLKDLEAEKSILFTPITGDWREAPSGDLSNSFSEFMKPHIVKDYYYDLDKLLMKCGRKAKELTKGDRKSRTSYDQFQELCRQAIERKDIVLGESQSNRSKVG